MKGTGCSPYKRLGHCTREIERETNLYLESRKREKPGAVGKTSRALSLLTLLDKEGKKSSSRPKEEEADKTSSPRQERLGR